MSKRRNGITKILTPLIVPKKIPKFDPNINVEQLQPSSIIPQYSHYSFNEQEYHLVKTENLSALKPDNDQEINNWINIDGLRKKDVEVLCNQFKVDPLIVEDILSLGQRAKFDDMGNQIYFILPMLTYNEVDNSVEIEQLSVIMGDYYLLSFQPDPNKDPFDQVRERLKNKQSQIRKRKIDYLCYALMDAIIDDYYLVLNKLSDRLELLEDEILSKPRKDALIRLNMIRRELMVTKRQISPVRELVSTFWHLDSELIEEGTRKYFKDIHDHIFLASEYIDNYRELSVNLQDLYMNQVNTKMNEVVKILTIVTTLLAPFTVIGSIFGMNFDVIPYSHHQDGFYLLVLVMFGISALMLYYFWKKKWY